MIWRTTRLIFACLLTIREVWALNRQNFRDILSLVDERNELKFSEDIIKPLLNLVREELNNKLSAKIARGTGASEGEKINATRLAGIFNDLIRDSRVNVDENSEVEGDDNEWNHAAERRELQDLDFASSFQNANIPVDSEATVSIELLGGKEDGEDLVYLELAVEQPGEENENASESDHITLRASGKNFVFHDIHSDHFVVRFDASFDYLRVPPSSGQLEEQPLRLTFDVDNIDATVTLTNPIEENHFRHMQRLASTMRREQIFPCLVPFDVDINNLEYFTLAVNAYEEPVLDDGSSESSTNQNTGQAAMSWVSAFMPAADPAMLKEYLDIMLPSILDSSLRPLVHRFMVMAADEMNCNDLKFMDFRDFFLEPAASRALGGSGTAPYGDLGVMVHATLNDLAKEIGEDGTSLLNDMIPPYYEFAGELYSFSAGNPLDNSTSIDIPFPVDLPEGADVPVEKIDEVLNIEGVEFGLYNARANNLNTILPPVGFLQPIAHPHKLQNEFSIGLPGKKLNVTINPSVGMTTGENGILRSMYNNFDFGFSIDSFQFAIDFLLTIPSYELLQFPLEDFLDIPCWIALVPVNDNADEGFQILTFLSRIRGLSMHLECKNCTSETFNSTIPRILQILNDKVEGNEEVEESAGGSSTLALFGYMFGLLTEEVMLSDFAQTTLDNAIHVAPLFCPHRPEYNETATQNATLFAAAASSATSDFQASAEELQGLPSAEEFQGFQGFPNVGDVTQSAGDQLVEGVNEGLEEYDELPVPLLFPYLTNKAIDTLLFTGTMVVHIALVALAGMITDLVRPEYEYKGRKLSQSGGAKDEDMLAFPKDRKLSDEIDVEYLSSLVGNFSFLADFMQPPNCTNPGAMQPLPFAISLPEANLNLEYEYADEEEDRRLLQRIFNSMTPSQVHELRRQLQESLSIGDISIEPDLKVNLGDRNYGISKVSLVGLDTIKDYENPDIVNDRISAGFGIENIKIELEFEVSAPTDEQLRREHPDDDDYVFSISLGMQDIATAFSLSFGIDNDQLKNLTLGSFLTIANIPQCIISSIDKFQLDSLDVAIGGLDYLNVDGFRSQHVARATEEFQQRMEEDFTDLILESVPVVFDPLGLIVINEGAKVVKQSFSDCPAVSGAADSYIDFRDLLYPPNVAELHGGSGEEQYGDIVHTAFGFVLGQLETDPETGLSKANNLLRSSCPNLPPYYNVSYGANGELYGVQGSSDMDDYGGDYAFELSDFAIENVDTIGALKVLNVTDESPYELNNALSIGVGGEPLRIKLTIYLFFHFWNQGILYDPIHDDMEFTVDLYSPLIALDGLLKIPENNVMEYPLVKILDFNCIIATLPVPEVDEQGFLTTHDPDLLGFGITNFTALLDKLHIQLNCRNCSSPLLYDMADKLNTEEGIEAVTEFTNNVLVFITTVLQERFLLDQIGSFIADSAKQCPLRPEYDPSFERGSLFESPDADLDQWLSEPTEVLIYSSFVSVLIGFAAVVVVIIWLQSRRAQKEWLSGISDSQYYVIHEKQRILQQIEKEVDEMTSSLLFSPDIPLFWRYFVPVMVVGNIGFFMSGHASLGGAGAFFITLAGEELSIPEFEPMSVWIMVTNMFSIGSYAAGTIMMLFSVAWPYFKQLVSLVMWVAPPRYVRSALRGQIFEWLDALAKWSMIDIFIMVVTVAGMYVDIYSPDVEFLPDKMYTFNLMAVPLWGLYANMIAQLISQISSHFIIYYHRHVVRVAKKRVLQKLNIKHLNYDNHANAPNTEETLDKNGEIVIVEKKTRLCDHHFAIPHGEPHDTCVTKRCVVVLLFGVAIAILILHVASAILPSMAFHFHGIIGIFMDVSQGMGSYVALNPWGFCSAFVMQGFFLQEIGDWMGLLSICIVFIGTVLVVPLLQMFSLVALWLVPMTDKCKKRMLFLIEVLIAWEYGEVFLLAVVLEAWMYEAISTLMFNPFCTSFFYLFQQLNHYGVLSDADAQCYSTSLHIKSGSYTLVLSIFLLYILNAFVTKAAIQYFREKEGYDLVPPQDVADEMMESASDIPNDDDSEGEREMKPFPVLFTDAFALAMQHSRTEGISTIKLEKQDTDSNLESTSSYARSL